MKIIIESKYLKPTDFNDGDKVTILDEGEYKPSQFGKKLNITVKLPSGVEKIATMNNTSQAWMNENFGDESEEWVNKEVSVFKVNQMVGSSMKKIVYFGEIPGDNTDDESGINVEDVPM